MGDVIAEYQRWKQQGENLRVEARQAIESRFRELLAEAVRLAEEYRSDFGVALKPAPPVTAFRYKAGKPKPKKAAKSKPPATAAKPEPAPPAKPSPKVAGLEKRLTNAKKKLDQAKASGASTRLLEDKIYELEDELRLTAHQ